jgi:hypothetical protein
MVQVTVVQMASVTVIRTDFHRYSTLFPPEDGVGQTQAWMSTYVSILRIPQMI